MIEIRKVEPTRANLKRFTLFATNLYKNNDCYVPPLLSDDINTLSPSKNPAFDFCRAAYFEAIDSDSGKMVGRIAAIINEQVNKRTGEKNGRFGFFDFVDNEEVSAALLHAAEDWLRKQGMQKIIGPLGFTDLDREGLLIDGFDELSTMATNYNYPYYAHHIEALGYEKESDWLEFVMSVPDGIPDKFNRIADIVKRKFNLRVVKFNSIKKIADKYGRAIFDLVNEAYSSLYQYSLLTDRQIESYIKQYLNLLDPNLVSLVVDADDNVIAVGLSMPSMSRALIKSRGKMFPFGWVHLLKGLKGKNDRVDLLLVAVKPEFQSKGVNALLFQDLIPAYIKRGFKYAESNPELESNSKVQSQWEYFEYRQHRRRRSYAKKL